MSVKPAEGTRSRDPEARKRKLIDAAIVSISEIGYNDVTVDTISETAGISRGLIGHYFKGKDQLLLEAVKTVAAEIGASTRKAVSAAGEDAVARLYATARASFGKPAFTEAHACVWAALAGNAGWSPELTQLYHELWTGYREALARLFERAAQTRGIELDARLAALTFTHLIEGLWVGWVADSTEISRQRAESACLTYLDAIFKQP